MTGIGSPPWSRALLLVVALALLNASLTFANVWPTPMVRLTAALSIELAIIILGLAALNGWRGSPSPRILRVVTAVWIFLVLGHYADVTAPALYGREVNLYWDLQFVPDVAGLFARAGSLRIVIVSIAAMTIVLTILYAAFRWAFGKVAEGLADNRRIALAYGAALIVALFALQSASERVPRVPSFAAPVSTTYARQARLVASAVTGSVSLPASPSFDCDFSRVKGADVFLIFLESYGAVTYDRPALAAQLAPVRARFEDAIRATNREVVSAFVESPTFGGSSWLAHITLMSGVEIRRPDANALLMTQKRDTLVTAIARHGYRTIALMPGLWQRWPEGAFYGFDEIYGARRLDYRGPAFGWFDMTDQFALARVDSLESGRSERQPLFVFFPTISTHTPFTPTPPYQPDWRRALTREPYDAAELQHAYEQQPDWLNLEPSYGNAMAYTLTTLAGYLRERGGRDLVIVLLGDHQPPALVSGPGAPWDVPVHVIASRREILDRLVGGGFRRGLTPSRPVLGRMQTLLPRLLDAFGDRDTPKG